MKPLIVMGMGRSGTRYFADILSAHESVLLYGEIPHSAMARFISLLDTLDKEHSRDAARKKRWDEKKLSFIFEAFKSMSMGRAKNKSGHLYVGHKTPRSEFFFDAYERHFKSAGVQACYFYCLRNPFDVWSSFQNMPWNAFENVNAFIECYNESYRRYIKASSRAKGRVHLLNLDVLRQGGEPRKFFQEKVFHPLEINVDDDFLDSLISKRNTNSSQNAIGRMPEEMSTADYDKIMGNEEISLIISEHFAWLV